MSSLEIVVALLRGSHVAALLSLVGTLVFVTLVVPSTMSERTIEASMLRRRLLRLARAGAVLALLLGIAWLTVESAVIADADSVATTFRALSVVAARTQFGHWLVVRGLLLLLAFPLLRQWRPGLVVAVILAAAALAVQPVLGHAGALGGSVGRTLILSEIVHLLAAGAWLGGLLPLFIAIGALPHAAAAKACRDFTPVGLVAVLLLAGTAVVQVTVFMGGLAGLFGTGYGHVALIKLGLFVVLLGLAAVNRLALTDRLTGSAPDTARRHMLVSVAVEMALGLCVVIAAGFLASHAPGTHEQPVWPFAWRPDLAILQDPASRGEVTIALAATAVSAAIAIFVLVWRKLRWPALLMAAVILALAAPHLEPLFVEAYPTSFWSSPTDFAVTAIVHGEKLFEANCAICHGKEGRGDGPAAQTLAVRPADLTAPHFLGHSEGDLFWFISHGIDAPNGAPAMPAFSGSISSDGIWALVDYLRAHHAGMAMQAGGEGDEVVPVPQFDALCADGTAIERADLRGSVVRIVALPQHVPPPPALPPIDGVAVRTLLLALHPPRSPPDAGCVAVEPEAWTAFAILLGVSPDELAGTEMLADANLWIRASWKSPDAGRWSDPRQAVAMIRDIAAHPIAPATGGGHAHHH